MAEVLPEARAAAVYDDGCLYVEYEKYYVTYQGKPIYTLSRTEFLIFSCLLREKDRLVNYQAIWQAVWGKELAECNTHVLRVHVANIRQKLASCGIHITAMPGVGYRLVISLASDALA